MADININPVNVSGLAQLAGRDMPALHLPLSPITTASSAVAQQNALTNQGINQQNANSEQQRVSNEIPLAQLRETGENTRQANMSASAQGIAAKHDAIATQRTKAIQNATDLKERMSKSSDEMAQHQAAAITVTMGLNSINQRADLNTQDKVIAKQKFLSDTNDAAYANGSYSKDPVINKQIYLQHIPLTQNPDKAAAYAQQEYNNNLRAIDAKQKGGIAGQVSQIQGSGSPIAGDTATQKDAAALGSINTQIANLKANNQPVPADLTAQQQTLQAKYKTPTQEGDKEIGVQAVKNANTAGAAAQQDQVNVGIMKTLSADPDVASGSLASGSTAVSKFMAAAAAAAGVPYDPHTAASEAFKDVSVRAQIDMLQGLKGRPNQSEWNKVGEAVPQITNTPQGRKLLVSMLDYNNEQKVQYASFATQYFHEHGNMSGANNAWNNFQASLGNPYDAKTKSFTGAEQLRTADFSSFITDPSMQKPGAVHIKETATSAPKVLTYNPKTGGLE